MKTITKQQLIDWRACDEGLQKFIKQTNNTDDPVSIVSLIGGENKIDDIGWLARELGLTNQLRWFALKCARLVEHLSTEAKECNDASERYLIDKSDKNREVLHDARHNAIATYSFSADSAASAATCCKGYIGAYISCADAAWNANYVVADVSIACADKCLKPKINELLKEVFA